jgi:hypothetical protein
MVLLNLSVLMFLSLAILLVKNLATLEAQSVARQTGQIMDDYGFSLVG